MAGLGTGAELTRDSEYELHACCNARLRAVPSALETCWSLWSGLGFQNHSPPSTRADQDHHNGGPGGGSAGQE
jgi:hypothetical protein